MFGTNRIKKICITLELAVNLVISTFLFQTNFLRLFYFSKGDIIPFFNFSEKAIFPNVNSIGCRKGKVIDVYSNFTFCLTFLFYNIGTWVFRCSCSWLFFKIGVLKDFAIFTGKHLQACNFIKKRLRHRYFPVNITECLRTAFYSTTSVATSELSLDLGKYSL